MTVSDLLKPRASDFADGEVSRATPYSSSIDIKKSSAVSPIARMMSAATSGYS